jgi:hypothetical protein
MIHVADAAAQVAALAAAPSPGSPVVLCDARPGGYTWRELMAEAGRACGHSPYLITVPRALIAAIGITNDFTMLLGATPMLTSAKARELLHPNWAVAPEELPRERRPRYDLRSRLLRHRGVVPQCGMDETLAAVL